MRLSVAIQTHPLRRSLVSGLVSALEPLPVDVVEDPAPLERRSPWRTYRRCLETTPVWATHRLVIQDDAKPCPGFAEAVENAVRACECRIVCLCVCHEPAESARRILRAEAEGRSWADLDTSRWLPAIANVWPVETISNALAFVDAQNWPAGFTADDEIIGRVARELGVAVSATVPSLVHHDDMAESIAGQKSGYGVNAGRVTCRFVPEHVDARLIAW